MPSDYLLEIDGIKGESQDGKHKEAIEVESFSFGATNDGSFSSGGGGGSGKVSFQDIHFTTAVNKASPLLMLYCANGKHIKKATLFIRKAGEKQLDFMKVTLSDILVSSYQSGGAEGSKSLPVDQFALNFAKIQFEYAPQKADGSLEGPVTGGWDLKKAEKV